MIEYIISIIAPHHCLNCNTEANRLLCGDCIPRLHAPLPQCYRCRAQSASLAICECCAPQTVLDTLSIRTQYTGVAKELLWKLKFGRAKSAAQEIAQLLPLLADVDPQNVLIVPLPTATSRIRHRGYDQSVLIAEAFAKLHGYKSARLLARMGQQRQVGANRLERTTQAELMYRLIRPLQAQQRSIVLIDDVITTGASLEAAARLLKTAGATHVSAVVFAAAQPQL